LERLTRRCKVTWVWSEGVKLYSRQVLVLYRYTKAHGSRAPVICTGLLQPPPPVWSALRKTVRKWTFSSSLRVRKINSVFHLCPKWDLNPWSHWTATEIGISPCLWTRFYMWIARSFLANIQALVPCTCRALGLGLSVWLTCLARALLHCCNSIAMLKGRKPTPIYRVIQEENSVFWKDSYIQDDSGLFSILGGLLYTGWFRRKIQYFGRTPIYRMIQDYSVFWEDSYVQGDSGGKFSILGGLLYTGWFRTIQYFGRTPIYRVIQEENSVFWEDSYIQGNSGVFSILVGLLYTGWFRRKIQYFGRTPIYRVIQEYSVFWEDSYIQGDAGGIFSILGGDNVGHVPNMEWLPRWSCFDMQIQKQCE